MSLRFAPFTVLLVVNAFASPPGSGETAALDEEISRARRELVQIQAERKKVRDDAARDRKDLLHYQERTTSRIASIKAESDSIRRIIEGIRKSNDSLSAVLTGIETARRRHGLVQEQVRLRLIAGCDSLVRQAQAMPPMASAGLTASLAWLRSELVSRGIDNTEAVNRIAQIARDILEVTGSIQIMQGISPVAGLSGTTYRIRLGAVFEAAVDEKATTTALWQGLAADGTPRWELIRDPAVASSVLRAVNIREGKTVPALVELPFSPGGAP